MDRASVRTLVVGGLMLFCGRPAQAEHIHLTKVGNSGTANGAQSHSTGTGIFDAFVRIQMTGKEHEHNTDGRTVGFDTKDQNHSTHSLNLNAFALDWIEEGKKTGRHHTLNHLEIHFGDSPSLTGYHHGFGAHSSSAHGLDASCDRTIELNGKFNQGCGLDDMFELKSTKNFSGFDGEHQGKHQKVCLHSKFGTHHQCDDEFEECSTSDDPLPPPVIAHAPDPSTAVLAIVGLGCVAGRLVRRRNPTVA